MEAERPHVPLSRLTHDVVQNSYKELHALLDSLADYEPEDRQSRLLDAVLKIRHRFARLSATVKWYMAYSAFHSSARLARNVCQERSTVFTLDADTLFQVSANARAAADHPCAVQEAAQVLGGIPSFSRVPKIVESAIGLDTKRDLSTISRLFFAPSAARHKQCPSREPNDINNAENTRMLMDAVQTGVGSKTTTGSSSFESDLDVLKKPWKDSKLVSADSTTSDYEDEADEAVTKESIERLRMTTRNVICASLPDGVKLIKAGVDPCAVAVRIGVPDAWTADVILDKLKLDHAFVVLLRFDILVDSHPDAPSAIRSKFHDRERPVPLRAEHKEPLRQMLSDRMLWAYEEARSKDDPNPVPSMLLCLCQAMSFECCGMLAMSHVRAQTFAFHSTQLWKSVDIAFSGVGADKQSNSPVQIRYWLRSHMRSAMTISSVNGQELKSLTSSILRVEHDSELPVGAFDASFSVKSINMEVLLLKCCRIRAIHELQRIREAVQPKVSKDVTISINSSGRATASLVVHFNEQGVGIVYGIALKAGSFFVQTKGPLSSALSRSDALAEDVRKKLWDGQKFFAENPSDSSRVLQELISRATKLIQRETTVRNAMGGGNDVVVGWLPGATSVEEPEASKGDKRVRPPLVAIERKRPRRFMTLASVANEEDEPFVYPGLSTSKRARSMPLVFSTSSDSYAFIQGRCTHPENVPNWTNELQNSAGVMGNWTCMKTVIDLRIRRDNLLRELEVLKLANPLDGDFQLKSPHRTPLKVKVSPMEVENAHLIIRENGGWEIVLTLANEQFEELNCRGQIVSYCPRIRVLRFRYPDHNPRTAYDFARDLLRARTAAALANGLNTNSSAYRMVRKLPTHVEVQSNGISFVVGLGKRVVEVEATPSHSLITYQFIPFAEEILQESAMDMGKRFGELLEMSLPMVLRIQSALPADPTVYKVRFSNALKARVMFGTANRNAFAIDVDARHEKGHVTIFDVARARQSIQRADSSSNPYAIIPVWPQIVNGLVEKRAGRVLYEGVAVRISVVILDRILSLIASKTGSA
ncbi:Mediator complex subunit MED14 [Gracilaria domingensis]|nr:Mediator complex subunit MED14 [Gracilaria domingensis]